MLVDVARQLFARRGKNNVTMNDIANESKKGRRTLYMYFKNKNDIYLAVIERELNLLLEKLQTVVSKDLSPDEMLTEYIFVRQLAVKEAIERNGSLRADFFRDIYEVEHARRRIDLMEMEMIQKILEKGIEENIFHCDDVEMTTTILLYSLKGMEVPFLRRRVSRKMEENKDLIIRFIFNGLKKK